MENRHGRAVRRDGDVGTNDRQIGSTAFQRLRAGGRIFDGNNGEAQIRAFALEATRHRRYQFCIGAVGLRDSDLKCTWPFSETQRYGDHDDQDESDRQGKVT